MRNALLFSDFIMFGPINQMGNSISNLDREHGRQFPGVEIKYNFQGNLT